MGKKKPEKEIEGDIHKLREQVTRRFFGLSERLYTHIVRSFEAEKPCMNCMMGANGEHEPGKARDEAGKCAFCHGTYVIPDNNQRNWAVEQAQPIVAPAPKPIEVQIEDKSLVPELEQQVKELQSSELKEKLRLLGVKVAEAEVISGQEDRGKAGSGGSSSSS